MKGVELYGRVRYAVQIEGLSHRETARRFGLDPRTVAKMVRFSVPPGYARKKPPVKPDTAKRVFERFRDEYGFTGGITIVKDYVAAMSLHRKIPFPAGLLGVNRPPVTTISKRGSP